MLLAKQRKPSLFKIRIETYIPVDGLKGVTKKCRVHLAYVELDLYLEYIDRFCHRNESEPRFIQEKLEDWYFEDFGRNADIDTVKGLLKFREDVTALTMKEYEKICGYNRSFKHGWLRIWVTDHMKKDIAKHS